MARISEHASTRLDASPRCCKEDWNGLAAAGVVMLPCKHSWSHDIARAFGFLLWFVSDDIDLAANCNDVKIIISSGTSLSKGAASAAEGSTTAAEPLPRMACAQAGFHMELVLRCRQFMRWSHGLTHGLTTHDDSAVQWKGWRLFWGRLFNLSMNS